MGGRAQVAALGANYSGSAVLIYDVDGNHLGSTLVTSHDRTSMRIEVQEIPPALVSGNECILLVLSSPAPCEYHGRLAVEGTKKIIAMYKGRVRENRGAVRYKVNTPAIIEHLIFDGKAHKMHTPVSVELIDISKSGVRFRTLINALSNGDRFQMRLKISDSEKLLIADAIHHVDLGNAMSEYGCHFIIGSERAV